MAMDPIEIEPIDLISTDFIWIRSVDLTLSLLGKVVMYIEELVCSTSYFK